RDQRRNARLSLRKLSELAGISNPYLSQIERGLRKPSAEILQGIARGLRISAETLYVRAGILDEEGDPPDLVAAVLRDPTLCARSHPPSRGRVWSATSTRAPRTSTSRKWSRSNPDSAWCT